MAGAPLAVRAPLGPVSQREPQRPRLAAAAAAAADGGGGTTEDGHVRALTGRSAPPLGAPPLTKRSRALASGQASK